jgi:hypothetical protein
MRCFSNIYVHSAVVDAVYDCYEYADTALAVKVLYRSRFEEETYHLQNRNAIISTAMFIVTFRVLVMAAVVVVVAL